MLSLYVLIPTALIFCAVAVKLLLWAIDSGQYEDLDKESWKILADDDPAVDPEQPGPPARVAQREPEDGR